MTARALITLLAGAALAAATQKPLVSRAALAALEKNFDQRIYQRFGVDDPMDLLGTTRGVYLDGFGALFTAELSLVLAPTITPFRPTISKDQAARLRERKLARLPALKQTMLDMMVTSAANLKEVPLEEQIVVGVSLQYYSWEDTAGLPGQILMQAQRKTLVGFESGRLTRAQLDAAVRVSEF